MTMVETSKTVPRTKTEVGLTVENIVDILGSNKPKKQILEQYRTHPRMFVRQPPPRDHDIDHHTRVLVLIETHIQLSAVLAGYPVYEERSVRALRESARTHDIARLDDEYDVDHGYRSGLMVLSPLFPIDPDIKGMVARINKEHVQDGLQGKHPLTVTFNMIDSLEWMRSGDFDPSYLYNDAVAHMLIPVARQLIERSRIEMMREPDQFKAVMNAGISMGIVDNTPIL